MQPVVQFDMHPFGEFPRKNEEIARRDVAEVCGQHRGNELPDFLLVLRFLPGRIKPEVRFGVKKKTQGKREQSPTENKKKCCHGNGICTVITVSGGHGDQINVISCRMTQRWCASPG